MAEDVWISLVSDRRLVASYQQRLGLPSPDSAWQALARRIAEGSVWKALPPARLVLRLGEHPSLALCGKLSERHLPLLDNCRAGLHHCLSHLRWVDWPEVRRATEDLAHQLTRHLGADLPAARFEAIPRGGYVVLGLLAQALDLAPEQLGPGPSAATSAGEPPVRVVVDDCSLSGARFCQFLASSSGPRVVFAHLASHRDLRAAALARDERVEACLAAIDLEEPAGGRQAGPSPEERYGWVRRLGEEQRLWLGQPEHVCFPWNEPDLPVWDPVADRSLPGWGVLPPAFRFDGSGPSSAAAPLHVLAEPAGAVRLLPGATCFEDGDAVAAANLERGASLRLEGTAASFWRALLRSATLEEAVRHLVGEYEVEPEACRRDLEGFLADLTAQGLLQRAEGAPG